MRTIERSAEIEAGPDDVWSVLSDLTAMHRYMPGVTSVDVTTDHRDGVGATRYCVFDDGVELEERVAEWHEGSGYVLETLSSKKVPMKSNRVRFALEAADGTTRLSQSMTYEMKGGVLAPLLERLAAGRMRSALDDALGGLKRHVEAHRS